MKCAFLILLTISQLALAIDTNALQKLTNSAKLTEIDSTNLSNDTINTKEDNPNTQDIDINSPLFPRVHSDSISSSITDSESLTSHELKDSTLSLASNNRITNSLSKVQTEVSVESKPTSQVRKTRRRSSRTKKILTTQDSNTTQSLLTTFTKQPLPKDTANIAAVSRIVTIENYRTPTLLDLASQRRPPRMMNSQIAQVVLDKHAIKFTAVDDDILSTQSLIANHIQKIESSEKIEASHRKMKDMFKDLYSNPIQESSKSNEKRGTVDEEVSGDESNISFNDIDSEGLESEEDSNANLNELAQIQKDAINYEIAERVKFLQYALDNSLYQLRSFLTPAKFADYNRSIAKYKFKYPNLTESNLAGLIVLQNRFKLKQQILSHLDPADIQLADMIFKAASFRSKETLHSISTEIQHSFSNKTVQALVSRYVAMKFTLKYELSNCAYNIWRKLDTSRRLIFLTDSWLVFKPNQAKLARIMRLKDVKKEEMKGGQSDFHLINREIAMVLKSMFANLLKTL